ncbi:tetraspanin family domain-containing protein [Phthorimaea operculella]|nr:tetraspanin family domain-containing protein [Phthorimaea operculella]
MREQMVETNRVRAFQSTQNYSQKMKFTKTETEYNMKSIRFLLLTITTMFIVIAALMIVLGISVYSHYHNFSYFYESTKSGRWFTPSIMSIFLGMVLLVVTCFGFFGSLKQSTCLVNVYALLLSFILIVKLVVVVLAFTTDSEQITNYIDIPLWGYTTDPEIKDEVDSLQIGLNCCGSSSYLDYKDMVFPANYSTVQVNREVDGDPLTLTVPQSCCSKPGDYTCLQMRTNSCKDALTHFILQNINVLGVLGVSVMFIQLLGVIFALLLARCIRKLKTERAYMSWKIKEQMIMARQDAKDKHVVYINHTDSSVA